MDITRLFEGLRPEVGTDHRGRPCYVPEPGVHVYGVGHRHPISHEPRVCVRLLEGEAVFCDRAGRPLRRLPAGLAGADPDLYLPHDAQQVTVTQSTKIASGSTALTMY